MDPVLRLVAVDSTIAARLELPWLHTSADEWSRIFSGQQTFHNQVCAYACFSICSVSSLVSSLSSSFSFYLQQFYAHCYGGHQFGYFAGQLGDGRALSMAEVVSSDGRRWELRSAALTLPAVMIPHPLPHPSMRCRHFLLVQPKRFRKYTVFAPWRRPSRAAVACARLLGVPCPCKSLKKKKNEVFFKTPPPPPFFFFFLSLSLKQEALGIPSTGALTLLAADNSRIVRDEFYQVFFL